jgi:hypothetical protein
MTVMIGLDGVRAAAPVCRPTGDAATAPAMLIPIVKRMRLRDVVFGTIVSP